jgi:hypothetical protein
MLNLRHRSKGRLNRYGARRQHPLGYGALQAGLNLNFTRGVPGAHEAAIPLPNRLTAV